jgi:hypothetical protein
MKKKIRLELSVPLEQDENFISDLGQRITEYKSEVIKAIDSVPCNARLTTEGAKRTENTIAGRSKARENTMHDLLANNDMLRNLYLSGFFDE